MNIQITLPIEDAMRLFWLSRFEAEKISHSSQSFIANNKIEAAMIVSAQAAQFELLSNKLWAAMQGKNPQQVVS